MRPVKTERKQKRSQVSPLGESPVQGWVDRGSGPPGAEAGRGKSKRLAQLVRGGQRGNVPRYRRSRAGPSLPGPGTELDWLQGLMVKVKSQHSGQTPGSPAPYAFSHDSQAGCSSSSLDSCRRTGSRQRKKTTRVQVRTRG